MRVLILFYSAFGHVYQMAKALAEGVSEVEGIEAVVRRVPETLSDEVLAKTGYAEAQQAFAKVPEATLDDLRAADAVAFGTPTRFGNMIGQMRQFLDSTGSLWAEAALVGKPGAVFTSSNTQHGGQESTILSVHTTMLHHGMLVVGLPYTFQGQMRVDEVTGCSPYGASTIAGPTGERQPSANELDGARFLGKRLAEITRKLSG